MVILVHFLMQKWRGSVVAPKIYKELYPSRRNTVNHNDSVGTKSSKVTFIQDFLILLQKTNRKNSLELQLGMIVGG